MGSLLEFIKKDDLIVLLYKFQVHYFLLANLFIVLYHAFHFCIYISLSTVVLINKYGST